MNLLQCVTDLLLDYRYIITLLVLISLLLFIRTIRTSRFKGWFGEFLVNMLAGIMLSKKKYHLMKNVTLPTDIGTTQIDHLIFSVYGVFVIETKNLKGWVFGEVCEKRWVQQIFKQRYSFQNPLHQNYKHIKTLESLLDIDQINLFSLIVFMGKSTFKNNMPENVTHGIGYIKYIKSKKQQVLTESDVQKAMRTIQKNRLGQSLKTNRNHVKHVRSIIVEKEKNLSCDLCGQIMELKEAKKGQNVGKKFWGCSDFPKCRSTKQLGEM